MRHKSKNKTRPLFTLSLEMTRLVNKTRLLLVPGVNLDIYAYGTEAEEHVTTWGGQNKMGNWGLWISSLNFT